MRLERIVLVTKPTLLEELRASFACSDDQLAYRLSTRGDSITEYVEAHASHHASLRTVQRQLATKGVPVANVSRRDVPMFLFRESDVVVAMGPDGLFVNIATYLHGQPMITVNPDTLRVDGVLMRHAPDQVARALTKLIDGSATIESVALAEVVVDGNVRRTAVNEFFVGRRDHVSARYRLRLGKREERQSSSGLLISTGTGSTGWIRSVAAGASAVTGGAQSTIRFPFARDARQIVYVVREPFASKYTGISLAFGALRDGEALEVISEMPEGGIISADGVLDDALEFPAGSVARLSVAKQTVSLVLPS